MSSIPFFPIRGLASRIPPDATAFPHRSGYHVGIYALWTDPLQNDWNIAWVRETWTAIKPFVGGGVYVNELGEDEGVDRVQAAYGLNDDRLQRIKAEVPSTESVHPERERLAQGLSDRSPPSPHGVNAGEGENQSDRGDGPDTET